MLLATLFLTQARRLSATSAIWAHWSEPGFCLQCPVPEDWREQEHRRVFLKVRRQLLAVRVTAQWPGSPVEVAKSPSSEIFDSRWVVVLGERLRLPCPIPATGLYSRRWAACLPSRCAHALPLLFPPPNPRLCIVNDELFVRNATTEEIRKAFLMPAPTPSSSPVPTLSAEQQEMLAAFSMQSGMNLEWSQK